MIIPKIDLNRDALILDSVESYMQKCGVKLAADPSDRINQIAAFRSNLYSKDVERMPTYALYLLSTTDYESDGYAKGMYEAISHHVLDPEFIEVLLEYLDTRRGPDAPKEKLFVGALLVDIVLHFVHDHTKPKTAEKTTDKKKGKEKDNDEDASLISDEDARLIEPARRAVKLLTADIASRVQEVCAELPDELAIVVGAAISIGGKSAIMKLISLDIPITADIFNIVIKDREVFNSIMKEILLLEKDELTKLTENQKTFVESLKRYVYTNLNAIENPQKIYQFLVYAYGTQAPDKMQKYYIQVNDCGPSYGYLHLVAKQFNIK